MRSPPTSEIPRSTPTVCSTVSPEVSADYLPVLDPVHNTTTHVKVPVRDPNTPLRPGEAMLQPSPYWGDEAIWDSQANVHNPMFDEKGRVWFTSDNSRPVDNPAYCKEGSSHPSAKLFPLATQRPATGHVRSQEHKSSRSSTRVSARTTCSSPRMPTTRCGPAAVEAAEWSAG